MLMQFSWAQIILTATIKKRRQKRQVDKVVKTTFPSVPSSKKTTSYKDPNERWEPIPTQVDLLKVPLLVLDVV